MEVAKIKITGTDATVSGLKKITSGMIGATVSIEYDDTWEGLNRQVVFLGPLGAVNADGNTIPPEVLRLSGHELKVGVYSYTDDGSRAIPTIWASLGMIQPGADPEGDESAAPTLPVWARMQNQIGNLDALKTKARTDLVAAINELASMGLNQEQIYTIIEQTLTQAKESGEFDGEPGPVGPQGPAGKTPDIAIGTVETLVPGSNAAASITGTSANPILNLGIPRGADGLQHEIPNFDLEAMGLPVVLIDGATVSKITDTAEIINAMSRGNIRIRWAINLNGMIFRPVAVCSPVYFEEVDTWEMIAIATTNDSPFYTMRCVIMITEGTIVAQCVMLLHTAFN